MLTLQFDKAKVCFPFAWGYLLSFLFVPFRIQNTGSGSPLYCFHPHLLHVLVQSALEVIVDFLYEQDEVLMIQWEGYVARDVVETGVSRSCGTSLAMSTRRCS